MSGQWFVFVVRAKRREDGPCDLIEMAIRPMSELVRWFGEDLH